MEYRKLGSTGIEVSPICLGTMMLGSWGDPDPANADAIVGAALDAGLNFVDTADVYSFGECEELVGRALKGRRDDVVLASKFHFPMGEGPNAGGNSRRWIRQAVEGSLRRLGTDRIDLYQVHRPDPSTDIDETLGALSDLVREGKVLAIGSSDFHAGQIVEAQWVAAERGHVRFRCEQPPYSIFDRSIEAAVLPTAARYGMGAITWSPLSSGLLTGRYRKGGEWDLNEGRRALQQHKFDPSLPGNAAKLDAIEELATIAEDAGLTLPHLAVGFVTSHRDVTSAIIGPRTLEQATSLLDAPIGLPDDVLDAIDEVVPPGVTLNPADQDVTAPEIADAALRRRPSRERAAAAVAA